MSENLSVLLYTFMSASAKTLDDGTVKLRPFSSAKNCIFFASASVFVAVTPDRTRPWISSFRETLT
jgi:hypothetical protein